MEYSWSRDSVAELVRLHNTPQQNKPKLVLQHSMAILAKLLVQG